MAMNNQKQNGGYPPRQQYDPRVAGAVAQQRKVKKPATKGTVVAITILITFIMLLIFSAGLIYISMIRSTSEQATYAQMLSDAENEVRDISANVSFSPAESIKKKVLSPSVSIKITKKANAGDNIADANINTLTVNTSASNGNNTNNNANNSNSNLNIDNNQGAVVQQQADNEGNIVYGSGVILSQNNDKYYIITNEHVIRSAETITVTVDGAEYKGELVGSDVATDLAVISIIAKNLTCAEVENGRSLPASGDFTISVGNPYGFNDSLSVGYVSATGRNIEYSQGQSSVLYANLIQTDSPVLAGCSGGGLYDASGTLIGINTLVAGDTAHTDDLGYAIPISYVVPIFKNLMSGNVAAHPSFGISLSNVTDEMISKYGLTDASGALVVSTTLAGPAETAGIVANDIIVSYNGEKVKNAKDMMFKIRASYINDENEIKILREGKEMTFKIKVGSDA